MDFGSMLIGFLAVFSLFFVPITGVMLILTSRFALKPLVETLSKAVRESGYGSSQQLPYQIMELSEQVQALTEEVERLREAHDFDRQLALPEVSDGQVRRA